MSRHTKATFSSSGTWTCPAGITEVIVLGTGGGGGGAGSSGSEQATGGLGSGQRMQFVSVVPNTAYTVTIGAGGSGGAAGNNAGSAGGDTSLGALAVFPGSPGGHDSELSGFHDTDLPDRFPINEGGFSTTIRDQYNLATSLNGFKVGDQTSSTYSGGGGAGGRGDGADGVLNGAGVDAAANTGAGGSGADDTSAAGGDGGSGYLEIIWLE